VSPTAAVPTADPDLTTRRRHDDLPGRRLHDWRRGLISAYSRQHEAGRENGNSRRDGQKPSSHRARPQSPQDESAYIDDTIVPPKFRLRLPPRGTRDGVIGRTERKNDRSPPCVVARCVLGRMALIFQWKARFREAAPECPDLDRSQHPNIRCCCQASSRKK